MAITTVQPAMLGTPQPNNFKNRIINGAMVIDQRNAGALIPAAGNQYVTDRWVFYNSQSSKFAVGQNAGALTPPAGFTNYLGFVSASAYSVLSTDYFVVDQCIEGFNVADLGWGTANAKTVTLSFQVYSSLTGTFGGAIMNSASNRSYPFTYTVSSASAWVTASVTIPGDTTGTWLTTNGIGMRVRFSLGVGSNNQGTPNTWQASGANAPTGAVSVVGTNGAVFGITGVQLEVGVSATGFDYRPYGTELALCQRYFFTQGGVTNNEIGVLANWDGTYAFGSVSYPVTMRSAPTFSNTGVGNFAFYQATNIKVPTSFFAQSATVSSTEIFIQWSGALTTGQAGFFRYANTSAYISMSAEL